MSNLQANPFVVSRSVPFNNFNRYDLLKVTTSPRYSLYYYEDQSWNPYPEHVNILLSQSISANSKSFDSNSKSFDYCVNGIVYRGDWDRLVERNESTGTIRCIGYRDEKLQKDHLPPHPFGSTENRSHVEIAKLLKRRPTLDVLLELDLTGSEASEVVRRFTNGLGQHTSRYVVTAVHKIQNSERKIKLFRDTAREVEQLRGSPNVQWAWHGTSAEALESIALYGFGQMARPKNGNVYGCGTYLAPHDKSYVSVPYSHADTLGEMHMLLCQAILGSQEIVDFNSSDRTSPSCSYYDTAVDSKSNPRLYVIWTPYCNSHTLVEYSVSFVEVSP